MKSFANDPSLDRVLLISREEMGGAAGGFDPLHPVYTQTEGADPFTYRNDFCHMRLLADGTMELTEFGRPARFAEEWRQLLNTELSFARHIRETPHPHRSAHL